MRSFFTKQSYIIYSYQMFGSLHMVHRDIQTGIHVL